MPHVGTEAAALTRHSRHFPQGISIVKWMGSLRPFCIGKKGIGSAASDGGMPLAFRQEAGSDIVDDGPDTEGEGTARVTGLRVAQNCE